MPAEQEIKVHTIDWNEFIIKFFAVFLIVLIVPHFLFWIPHWLQIPGWELFGQSWLPSLLLLIFYLLFCFGFIGVKYSQLDALLNRFPVETKSDQITFERIQVPIGGGHFLPGDIIKGALTPKKNAPVLILCHGLGGERTGYYQFAIPLSFMGFACVLVDSRGHGENEGVFGHKWEFMYIIKDFGRVVDFIEKRAAEVGDLDSSEIVAWGASMGGIIVLNDAYLDERIKFIIAVCTLGDATIERNRKMNSLSERVIRVGFMLMGVDFYASDLQIRFISPILNSFNKKKGFFGHPVPDEIDNDYRVMLAHCKDDEILNYENFEVNRDFLNMPPENFIDFETGNHAFAGLETALVGKMLLWFWMRGY